jgi:ubiquinone/menaquinone biosynthesis C-methylase UbiE/uncharacterized protein YbaR (Trm112 family)
MLRDLAHRLICPTCRDPRSDMGVHSFQDGSDGHVHDGVLICSLCREWYPIEDEVLEFVRPEMLYPEDAVAFERRFASRLAALGCKSHELARTPHDEDTEQRKQREHFDRYAESLEPGFQDYTRSIFIQAASARFTALWKARLSGTGGWILDIGCGTGISSFPFAGPHTVVGFDISKKVIRRDTEEARKRGLAGKTTFFVGDGTFLAFKDESFDFAQTFGALHHLPNPAQAVKDIVRLLKPGGTYFGVENNKTSFRWIFDLMMKVKPLWVEEAGAEPLISADMVRGWARGLPADVHCETSVFLPPHLLNVLPLSAARSLLDWSDRLCLHVPWVRGNGGQIIFAIRRLPGQLEAGGGAERADLRARTG